MFAGQPPANRIKNLKEKKYFKYGFEFQKISDADGRMLGARSCSDTGLCRRR